MPWDLEEADRGKRMRLFSEITIDEVVFAQKSDFQRLGARTLEGLNLKADPRNKKLVGAGPIAVPGNVIQIASDGKE